MSDKPLMLMYENTPALMTHTYSALLLYGTMGASALKQFVGVDASPTLIPTLEAIQKHLSPSISAMSADQDGIIVETYSSTPLGVTSVSCTTILAGALVPAMHSATNSAQNASSMSQMHLIGSAVAMYVNDDNGKFPPDLDALAKGSYIPSSRSLVSPISHRPDYTYIRVDKDAGPEMIVAYENPANYHNGRVLVLYTDFHVAMVPVEQFRRDLKATMEYVTKKEIPQPGGKTPTKDPKEDF